jgi:hypothetical protein
MEMSLSYDLARAWRDYIAKGGIENEFVAGYNGPERKWKKGDLIKAGLRLDSKSQPRYFAVNVSVGKEIALSMEKATLEHGFKKQFNPYRLLRPGLPPQRRDPGPQAPTSSNPADCGFKCEEPGDDWSFRKGDPLVAISLPNGLWGCYENFCPFEAEGHFLWVRVQVDSGVLRTEHMPQVMTEELLSDGLTLFRGSKGLLVFFNSLHAGASQDHFHFQAVYAGLEPFAIESAKILEDGGYAWIDGYPIEGLIFPHTALVGQIYKAIKRLNEQQIPYNLIMLRERVYVIPRNAGEEVVEEFPYGVLASMEMAGKFILSDSKNYLQTDCARIRSALEKISLSREQIAGILGGPE